jgi:hypothetical protein
MITDESAGRDGTGSGFGFFTRHEAAVVTGAAARLVPGPADDPAESGHPGAREADVIRYIDMTLAALGAGPARIHAGGPWSDRHSPEPAHPEPNHMAVFVTPTTATRIAWERRLGEWRQRYRAGVAALDTVAGGDFAQAGAEVQDRVLAAPETEDFVDLLFCHTVEGMYANPEYGGNRGLAGWADIGFPGDTQPRGYRDEEVERSDGPDPADRVAVLEEFIAAVKIEWSPAELSGRADRSHPSLFAGSF